jgi:hypothetical protein
MDGLGDELFSSAALTLHKHGCVGFGHEADQPAHIAYLGTPSNDRREVHICLYEVFAIASVTRCGQASNAVLTVGL